MVAIDAWHEHGFGEVAKNYLARLAPEQGLRRDLDDNGDLLLRRVGEADGRAPLAPGRRSPTPSWLDPATGGPRAVKLLRTIRLDPSDTFVFERAAEPGEWAVSGAFMFADADPGSARRQAARRLPRRISGRQSFGWSTLVQIVEASEEDRAAVVELLAQQLQRASRRARPRRRAGCGGGGSRVRGLALRSCRATP